MAGSVYYFLGSETRGKSIWEIVSGPILTFAPRHSR